MKIYRCTYHKIIDEIKSKIMKIYKNINAYGKTSLSGIFSVSIQAIQEIIKIYYEQ